MDEWIIVLVTLFATVIGAFGSLYLKKGAAHLDFNLKKQFKNFKLFFGLFLFLFSSVFYVWALRFADLSIIYPITSFSYIWVCLLSVKFLNERMNIYKWFGIFLILMGVFLITR
ncbi:MAG: EamA family transporter [Nanoarchaeota archaeon]|nr:EamA family transporter [Nanoarchaeota archaeon]